MDTTNEVDVIKSQAKVASSMARTQGEPHVVFRTRWGIQVGHADWMVNDDFSGQALIVVLPSGDVLSLVGE